MAQGLYCIIPVSVYISTIITIISSQTNPSKFNIDNTNIEQCTVEEKQANNDQMASKLIFEKIPAKDLHISRYGIHAYVPWTFSIIN